MRKAYRRKGGDGRKYFYAGVIFLAAALFVVMSASAISRLLDGIPISEWDDAWAFPALGVMIAAGIAFFAVLYRGPRTSRTVQPGQHEPLAATAGSQSFPGAKSMALASAAVMAALAVLAAALVTNIPSPTDSSGSAIEIGLKIAIVAAPLLCALWPIRFLLRCPTLTIDAQGIRVSGPGEWRAKWSEIAQIQISKPYDSEFDPESDTIEIHLRSVTASASSWPFRRRSAGRPNHSKVLKLKPWERYGVSPTIILDALDRFRPANLQIHDPRRTADDGSP